VNFNQIKQKFHLKKSPKLQKKNIYKKQFSRFLPRVHKTSNITFETALLQIRGRHFIKNCEKHNSFFAFKKLNYQFYKHIEVCIKNI